MGILNAFFKPKPSILSEEDLTKLKNIERVAYMEEAEKLVKERGKLKAKTDLEVKQAKTQTW